MARIDTEEVGTDLERALLHVRAATASLSAAAGRFLGEEMADDDEEPLLVATAKLKIAAGRFFGGGMEEELAVGSVPLSPSSPPPPAWRFLATPPRTGVVSQIVTPACAGAASWGTAWHSSKGATERQAGLA